jgi:hypothetical protein
MTVLDDSLKKIYLTDGRDHGRFWMWSVIWHCGVIVAGSRKGAKLMFGGKDARKSVGGYGGAFEADDEWGLFYL